MENERLEEYSSRQSSESEDQHYHCLVIRWRSVDFTHYLQHRQRCADVIHDAFSESTHEGVCRLERLYSFLIGWSKLAFMVVKSESVYRRHITSLMRVVHAIIT